MTACPTREQLYSAVVDAAETCHMFADLHAQVEYRRAVDRYRAHRWACLTCASHEIEMEMLEAEAWK